MSITKEDLRDLKEHIDKRFDKQDKDLAGMRRDINAESKVNAEQAVEIKNNKDAIQENKDAIAEIKAGGWKFVMGLISAGIIAIVGLLMQFRP